MRGLEFTKAKALAAGLFALATTEACAPTDGYRVPDSLKGKMTGAEYDVLSRRRETEITISENIQLGYLLEDINRVLNPAYEPEPPDEGRSNYISPKGLLQRAEEIAAHLPGRMQCPCPQDLVGGAKEALLEHLTKASNEKDPARIKQELLNAKAALRDLRTNMSTLAASEAFRMVDYLLDKTGPSEKVRGAFHDYRAQQRAKGKNTTNQPE